MNDRGDKPTGHSQAVRTPADHQARVVPPAAAGGEPRRRLDAMFKGGSRPPPGQEARSFAGPRRTLGRGPSDRWQRLERLRLAREPGEVEEAADHFLKHHHQLPDDVDILLKLLQHRTQKVVRDALGQLSSLIYQGRMHNMLILLGRLDDLEARGDLEPATTSLVVGVRAQAEKRQGEHGRQAL